MSRHISWVVCSIGVGGWLTPALLTSTSTLPKRFFTTANNPATRSGSRTSHGMARMLALFCIFFSQSRRGLGQVGGLAPGDDDVTALEGERPGDGIADAAAGAGYDGDLSGQAQGARGWKQRKYFGFVFGLGLLGRTLCLASGTDTLAPGTWQLALGQNGSHE